MVLEMAIFLLHKKRADIRRGAFFLLCNTVTRQIAKAY